MMMRNFQISKKTAKKVAKVAHSRLDATPENIPEWWHFYNWNTAALNIADDFVSFLASVASKVSMTKGVDYIVIGNMNDLNAILRYDAVQCLRIDDHRHSYEKKRDAISSVFAEFREALTLDGPFEYPWGTVEFDRGITKLTVKELPKSRWANAGPTRNTVVANPTKPKLKAVIDSFEYRDRIGKYYNAHQVKVSLGDLDLVMKAARRTTKYLLELDRMCGSANTVETKEMTDAFTRVNDMLKDIRHDAKKNATDKVENHYELGK